MIYLVSYKKYGFILGVLLLTSSLKIVAQTPICDLSVEDLFRLGTENSIQLKASRIQEIISEDEKTSASYNRLPDIHIGATAGVIGQPIVFQRGLSQPVYPETPDWSQNYNIELTQPLYQGGKIQNNIHKADIQRQIAHANTANDKAGIKLILMQQYLNLCTFYKQKEVFARSVEESQIRLKDISHMKSEGLLTRNDELRSKMQLTNDSLAYKESINNIILASQQLDILLGLDETQLIAPDTTLLSKAMDMPDYESFLQIAYENYPGIQIARLNSQLAKNDIKLARANYLPNLSLHAGNTLARPLSTTLADMYNNNWNISLSISYDLSSLYHNKPRMNEAKQMVHLRQNAEEQLMQNIRINVKSAYIHHQEALDRIEALKLSVKQAEENYRIVHNRYLNQLSILIDLLDASSVRLNAELQLTVARTQAVYTYYELQRACGSL